MLKIQTDIAGIGWFFSRNVENNIFRGALTIYTLAALVVGFGVIISVSGNTNISNASETALSSAIGVLLCASLLYQNAIARKIYWIGGYIANSKQTDPLKEWENAISKARKKHPLVFGFWSEIRVIAYCYAFVIILFSYIFKDIKMCLLIYGLALFFCIWLWIVPCYNYKNKWKRILNVSEDKSNIS